MNMMKYKNFYAELDYSDEDNLFYGKIAGIKSLISFEGDSVNSLRKGFQEAVNDYLNFCEKLGRKPEKPYSGNITLRIEPEDHIIISLAAKKAGRSLNKFIAECAKTRAKQLI
jgi:predicted HicB family RNase H-like nuclease